MPCALNLAQPGYVQGQAFFLENATRHRHKLARVGESSLHRAATTTLVVIDVALDQRVTLEREVDVALGLFKGLNIGLRNVLFFRRQYQLTQFIQWRWLKLLLAKTDLCRR